MEVCVQTFQNYVNNLRTGRASPAFLNSICVEYFGSQVPLRQISNIVVEDYHTLKVNVFDHSIIPVVVKSILNSNLGLNPIVNNEDIRIPVPALTEERRKHLIKVIRSNAEQSRICVRKIRRDANEKISNFLKNKVISSDEERISENYIQKITDKYIQKIDLILLKKNKELMSF